MHRTHLPGHRGQVSSCHPSPFQAAHLSDFGIVHFSQWPFCLLSDNVSFGLWSYVAWKKWVTEKKQSKVIHTPKSWSWQWQDGLPENTDRPVRGLHWPILCLKRRPGPEDSSDWKGPQKISALTCSLQAQHWGQTWLNSVKMSSTVVPHLETESFYHKKQSGWPGMKDSF